MGTYFSVCVFFFSSIFSVFMLKLPHASKMDIATCQNDPLLHFLYRILHEIYGDAVKSSRKIINAITTDFFLFSKRYYDSP